MTDNEKPHVRVRNFKIGTVISTKREQKKDKMKRLSSKRLISLPCGKLESLFAVLCIKKMIEYLGRRHRTTEDVNGRSRLVSLEQKIKINALGLFSVYSA